PPHTATTIFPYTTLFRSRQGNLIERLVVHRPARRRIGDDHDQAGANRPQHLAEVHHRPSSGSNEPDIAFHCPDDRVHPAAQYLLDRKSTRLNSSHSQISY